VAASFTLAAEELVYSVVPDLTTEYSALIVGNVEDELSDEMLDRVAVSTSWPATRVSSGLGGLFAISGYPERALPELASRAYTLDLTFQAPGYVTTTRSVLIPAGSTLPVTAPPVRLRPLPVRLQGRITDTTTAQAPVSGARVRAVDNPLGPPVDHTLLLRTPVSFSHAAATAVRVRALTPTGASCALAAARRAGQTTATLTSRAGVVVGSIVQFGTDVAMEFGVVAALAPQPANPTLPGDVTLQAGLQHSHATATSVLPVTAGPIAASATLAEGADAGDGVLLITSALDGATVEILDAAPAHTEYRAVGALTDVQGYYGVDGVGRTDTLYLDVDAAGFSPLSAPVAWRMHFDGTPNIVDFKLSP
jgi:hypothetical protein